MAAGFRAVSTLPAPQWALASRNSLRCKGQNCEKVVLDTEMGQVPFGPHPVTDYLESSNNHFLTGTEASENSRDCRSSVTITVTSLTIELCASLSSLTVESGK